MTIHSRTITEWKFRLLKPRRQQLLLPLQFVIMIHPSTSPSKSWTIMTLHNILLLCRMVYHLRPHIMEVGLLPLACP